MTAIVYNITMIEAIVVSIIVALSVLAFALNLLLVHHQRRLINTQREYISDLKRLNTMHKETAGIHLMRGHVRGE